MLRAARPPVVQRLVDTIDQLLASQEQPISAEMLALMKAQVVAHKAGKGNRWPTRCGAPVQALRVPLRRNSLEWRGHCVAAHLRPRQAATLCPAHLAEEPGGIQRAPAERFAPAERPNPAAAAEPRVRWTRLARRGRLRDDVRDRGTRPSPSLLSLGGRGAVANRECSPSYYRRVGEWGRNIMVQGGNKHEFQFAGGLVFDEIKLQEGLCWDQKSDTLLGFADSSILSSEASVRVGEGRGGFAGAGARDSQESC